MMVFCTKWFVRLKEYETMTSSDLLLYCMAKRGAEQSVHSDWKATQIKVADVLFAMVKDVEDRPAVSLKTSPELAELLRQQHKDVRPSRHLNKAHWSTLYLDGSLPNSQIYYLVDASYQLAVELLPEALRQQMYS
jgi:predicted DNA-binding protein (MmcQ/YjbR family)